MHIPVLAALVLGATPTPTAAPVDARGVEFFEKKIRPVLAAQCYSCHSAEAQARKKLRGGLLLDTREGLLKGGDSGPAVVPGDSRKSPLLSALRYDGDTRMPPRGKLPEAVVADFAAWIDMGAPDPRQGQALPSGTVTTSKDHWAFRPLAPVKMPAVEDTAWVRTPVDNFILARLEGKKLSPARPLSKEKLARRAYFDLVGLPPTPEEVDEFVKDSSPGAYEKLLDRLLASERYGERWGRHWLDVARFAESGGYEFDKDRPGAYHYRDFVIRALNADLPYDQFVRLQVAGDHLAPGDYNATAATGFLVAGPFPGQITAKTRELIRYDHLDDMASTLGSGLLGLTVGCARCHDHKFDPIPQKDYYSLLACLGRTDSEEVKVNPDPEGYRKVKEGFDRAHAPLVEARQRFEKEELPGRLRRWLEGPASSAALTWLLADPVEAKAPAGRTFRKLPDGSLLAEGPPRDNENYTFVLHTAQKGITSLRVEALSDDSLPKKGPGRGTDGTFLLDGVTMTASPAGGAKPGKAEPVPFASARYTFQAPSVDPRVGWSVAGAVGKSHSAAFDLESPVGFEGGTTLTLTLKFTGAALGRVRLALSTARTPALDGAAAPQAGHELRSLAKVREDILSGSQRDVVLRWFRQVDAEADKLYRAEEDHARKEPQPNLVTVFAASSGKGGDVHFLTRGEVGRKNGLARPGFLKVLTRSSSGEERWLAGKEAAPRVALASWLTDADEGAGPLLARVLVNRLWQHHFGKGLVRTPNDFGAQGEPPTHPELLDWLAADLVKGGWKLKRMHKLLMMSSAYLQGDAGAEAQKADPDNHLWGRVPPRRLEAEVIRDSLLAVGGTLDTRMYGPGTLDAGNPRRSIYLTVKRSQMVPLLATFDAPEGVQSVAERSRTTVPPQALALLNAPFVRQQAVKLAARVRPKSADDLPQAVEDACRTALGRRPAEAERQRMAAFVRQQAERSGVKGPAALEAALADLCQVLLCLNEFVYAD